VRKSPSNADKSLSQATRAWETCAPGQTFADMTLEQFNEKAKAYRELAARFEAAGTQWDAMRVELVAEAGRMMDLVKGLASSVKGHAKFGENSAMYKALGYVRASERASGLTRRREAEAVEKKDAVEA
jgi:hypothetical protein